MGALTLCVTLLLLLTGAHVTSANDRGCGAEPNGMLPFPGHCNMFVQCSGKIPFIQHCQPGMYWNKKYKYCDWPVNVDCDESDASIGGDDTPTEKITMKPPTEKNVVKPHTEKNTMKPPTMTKIVNDRGCGAKPNGLLPLPGHCNMFVQCFGKIPQITHCQPGLQWNKAINRCDWPYNVDCDESVPRYDRLKKAEYDFEFYDDNENFIDNKINDGYPEKVPKLPAGSTTCPRRVCYYTNWAQYRPDIGKFFPKNIDATLCTHIIYAFANLKNNELAYFEWNDKAMIQEVMKLKKEHPDLPVLVAVGGWNMGSVVFSNMVHSDVALNHFVTTSVQFLKNNNYDGLDLIWKYPTTRGGRPTDKAKFTLLVKKLYDAFESEAKISGKPRMLLTAAVSPSVYTAERAYEIKEISRYLDFVDLMAYDLWGPWQTITGHMAALNVGSDSPAGLTSVTDSVDFWLKKGFPANKLVLGLSFYGKSFMLADPKNPGVNKKCRAKGLALKYTSAKGQLSYYEACYLIKSGAAVQWLTGGQEAPTLSRSDGYWAGYNDRLSIAHKVNLARSRGLGGVMVWALGFDDFGGNFCGLGKYPLMNAIKEQCDRRPTVDSDLRKGSGSSASPLSLTPILTYFYLYVFVCAIYIREI